MSMLAFMTLLLLVIDQLVLAIPIKQKAGEIDFSLSRTVALSSNACSPPMQAHLKFCEGGAAHKDDVSRRLSSKRFILINSFHVSDDSLKQIEKGPTNLM